MHLTRFFQKANSFKSILIKFSICCLFLINPIAYADEVYSKSTEKILFKSSQKTRFRNLNKTVIIRLLETLKAGLEPGISINCDQISCEILDGTCSAMSIGFAASYLSLHHEMSSHTDQIFETLKREFSCASIDFAYLQAAFNCLEILPEFRGCDMTLTKMQTLANFYGLIILDASKSFEVMETYFSSHLEKSLGELQNGVHLVRMIQPADNEKMEIKGHTTIFIKRDDSCLFYDPNEGLIQWFSEVSNRLTIRFITTYRTYDVHAIRFYRCDLIDNQYTMSDILN